MHNLHRLPGTPINNLSKRQAEARFARHVKGDPNEKTNPH